LSETYQREITQPHDLVPLYSNPIMFAKDFYNAAAQKEQVQAESLTAES
jgi:hypothetical protein